MRHRLCNGTGLGNPDKILLNNQWSNNERLDSMVTTMLNEAIDIWFKNYNGLDFSIDKNDDGITVAFGIEPSYKYDPLEIYSICSNKDDSYKLSGKAWGVYGSDIVKTIKPISIYKKSSKFTRFTDKWSKRLKDLCDAEKQY